MKLFFKKYLPRSLFARSILILILPIILILAISTYVFFERHWERMAARFAFSVAGEISFLADVTGNIQAQQSDIAPLSDRSLRHLQLSLKLNENAVLKTKEKEYSGRSFIIFDYLDTALSEALDKPYTILVDTNKKWVQVNVQIGVDVLTITVPQRRLFSSSGYVFLLWMVVVSFFLIAVAILFMRNQIRPIKRLAVAAERFGKGRDVPFFKEEGAREVRAAARSFIGMRDRINRQIQQRTFMLAGVSHDLRTPLTRMKLQLEMMPESKDVDALKSDIADMQKMIDAYLQFTKGEGDEEMQRFNLVSLLEKQKEYFDKQGLAVSVTQEADKNFDLFIKPVAIERCLNNIMTNSLKFSNKLDINISRDDDYITMVFDDDGVGIEVKKYEDVFKPFYREDKSRNISTGGVGLGLPVTQDIIFSHGGNIDLDKSPIGGLRVVIKLPV